MKPIHSLSALTMSAALGILFLPQVTEAADPDFSTLDQKPTESAPTGQTRGLTRGLALKPAPTAPTRSYDPSRGLVVIEEADGAHKEEPYVVLPILFKKDSDEVLDAQSANNLRLLAAKLNEPQFSAARFVVEGHTSTEGGREHNLELSRRRAARILTLLTSSALKVDAGKLSIKGYGPDHPEATPESTELDRTRNRRVLVVREQ
jgi:outer membrane protein OmpA-like peptidoglycan-associated protein